MKCGPKAHAQIVNNSPTTTIKADGTFSRSETYTIRWTDGSRERYRVTFKGRFLADGAVGTLRARSQLPQEAAPATTRATAGRSAWSGAAVRVAARGRGRLLAVAPAAASADTHYGGAAVRQAAAACR